MFFLCVILNTISSYLIASIFKNYLIFFISYFAFIVLNVEILSLFNKISDVGILIFSIINLIFAILFFRYKKAEILKFNIDRKRIKNAILLDKSLIILSFCFLVLICATLFLSVVMPVLEPDSQTYHFFRAWEFVKNGSLNHFETNDVRALIMPFNSEIVYAWMFALKKNLAGYGVLSFISFLAVIFSLWSISDEIKLSYRKRLWAIFLFSSLPAVIIQMPSMQTSLLVGALLLISFALFIKNYIYFSSLALALAFGTKTTSFIAFFGFLVLIFGWEYLINKKIQKEKFIKFFSFLALNFLVFSSYCYIQNILWFKNPFSNNAAYISHKFWGGLQGYIANIINYIFQFFDFTAFKWGHYLNHKILAFKDIVFEVLGIPLKTGSNIHLDIINIATDEQTAGFGILGFLVFIPLVFKGIFCTKISKNKINILYFLLSLTFLINFLVLSCSIAYMVYSIRFILTFLCLSSLIFAFSYSKKRIYKYIIIFFSAFYMFLLPFCIKRMPLVWVVRNLRANHFNQEKFIEDAYRGKIISVMELEPNIYASIEKKYKDAKKIGVIKRTISLLLYLTNLEKQGKTIDFINLARINPDKLNEYDLLIVENVFQDDNVFNPWDIQIDYKLEGHNVVFKDNNKLNCFYSDVSEKVTTDPKKAHTRSCFTKAYIQNNSAFKLSQIQRIYIKQFGRTVEIYYFNKPN